MGCTLHIRKTSEGFYVGPQMRDLLDGRSKLDISDLDYFRGLKDAGMEDADKIYAELEALEYGDFLVLDFEC